MFKQIYLYYKEKNYTVRSIIEFVTCTCKSIRRYIDISIINGTLISIPKDNEANNRYYMEKLREFNNKVKVTYETNKGDINTIIKSLREQHIEDRYCYGICDKLNPITGSLDKVGRNAIEDKNYCELLIVHLFALFHSKQIIPTPSFLTSLQKCMFTQTL